MAYNVNKQNVLNMSTSCIVQIIFIVCTYLYKLDFTTIASYNVVITMHAELYAALICFKSCIVYIVWVYTDVASTV